MVRDVDRHRVGHEPLERDVVERLAAGDLVRRRVHVRADVVEQVVLRHPVAVVLHDGDVAKAGPVETREDGHVVGHVVREIHHPHEREYERDIGRKAPATDGESAGLGRPARAAVAAPDLREPPARDATASEREPALPP